MLAGTEQSNQTLNHSMRVLSCREHKKPDMVTYDGFIRAILTESIYHPLSPTHLVTAKKNPLKMTR